MNAYTNLCANISGTKAGKSKPLDEYYTVLENTYNFASETEALRGMAQLYLADAVIRGGTLAGLAATLVGDVDVSNAVDTAYKTALAES